MGIAPLINVDIYNELENITTISKRKADYFVWVIFHSYFDISKQLRVSQGLWAAHLINGTIDPKNSAPSFPPHPPLIMALTLKLGLKLKIKALQNVSLFLHPCTYLELKKLPVKV